MIDSTDTNGSSSIVDSTAGTIVGNLTFRSGNDTLVAHYVGTPALVTGITGAIDGGAGTDKIRLAVDADTTIDTPVTLFANFEQLDLAPGVGVTATLSNGFTTNGTIGIAGSGTVDNRTTIQGSGQLLVTDFDYFGVYPGRSSFVNDGIVASTGTSVGVYAINFGFGNTNLTNTGTITADGNAISYSAQGVFNNSGAIIAGETASTPRARTWSIRGRFGQPAEPRSGLAEAPTPITPGQ